MFCFWRAHFPPLGRYVEGIVHLFYPRDDVVRGDLELQAWCREITEVGLCKAQDRGKVHPTIRDSWEALQESLPRDRTPTPHYSLPSEHDSGQFPFTPSKTQDNSRYP